MAQQINVRLDYTPRQWQHTEHVSKERFTVLAIHRRAGKTKYAVMEMVNAALKCKLKLPLYAYVAPFLKQAKQVTWDELKSTLEPLRQAGAVTVNESELTITFTHNQARIRLFGADNPDALRGVRLDGVVMDEVAQIKPALWEEVVQPALADRLGWALFIGTPNGINLFSELFFAAQAGRKDWRAVKYTVYETNALDLAEVERQKQTMTETRFAREYLCDFAASGEDQLIALFEAEEASRRMYAEKDIYAAPRVLGVDPARFGDDRSVLMKRQGLQAFPPMTFKGIDNMQLAAIVAEQIELWQPDGVFIDHGAGAGVIDRLRQLGYDVVEVPFGGTAIRSDLFANRRAEMWWNMREWIRNGGAIPNDASLKQELATPVYWYDRFNKKVLEGKDEIKKRLQGGSSPDIADALALTFALTVPKKRAIDLAKEPKKPVKEYDPYAAADFV